MDKTQKEILQNSLDREKKVLRDLKGIYNKALEDIDDKLARLMKREEDAEGSELQSIIYQKQYQEALKKQINGIIDNMDAEQFTTISDYLSKSYEEGFFGAMYEIHSQGIPLVIPIDQDQVVRALQTESNISEGLYKKLGEDTTLLKKRISNNIARGIAQGSSYTEIAKNIAGGMVGYNPKKPGGTMSRAMRIARTEGHRIQETASNDAKAKAISKGADILKQWDATLDGRTRDSHRQVDGEIRKFDEPFSNGLMFPGDPDGSASEVINCRCVSRGRARWMLDEDELNRLKERADFYGLDKTENFEDFKKKYLKATSNVEDFDITENGKYIKYKIGDKNVYADRIENEYTTQKITIKEVGQMWRGNGGYIQNSEGYADINDYLRGLKEKIENPQCRITEKIMDRVTNNNALKKDYIGFRKVDMKYLENVLGLDIKGLTTKNTQLNSQGKGRLTEVPKDKASAEKIAEIINGLVGTEKATVNDKAYTSVSLSEKLNYFTHYPIQFEIQMPKGTKGILTSNLAESEFITKKNTSIEILGAMVYNDGKKDNIRVFSKMIQGVKN